MATFNKCGCTSFSGVAVIDPGDGNSGDTVFGAMMYNISDPAKKVAGIQKLGSNLIARMSIAAETYRGNNGEFNTYKNYNVRVQLNIVNKRVLPGGIPFVTDLTAYSTTVRSILTKYPPEIACFENEETNPNYYGTSNVNLYLDQLAASVAICNELNIPCSNGGLQGLGLYVALYRYLVSVSDTASATAVGAAISGILYAAQHPGFNAGVDAAADKVDTLLTGYAALSGLDYVNFHNYPLVGFDVAIIYEALVNWLTFRTGKPVICNEVGTSVQNSELVTNVVNGMKNAGVQYALWWSGDNVATGVTGLTDTLGNLTVNGNAYKAAIL